MASLVTLRPSGAPRWAFCSGAPLLEANYPERVDDSTREGQAVHDCAERIVKLHTVSVGEVMSNGVILTDEMLEHADEYAKYLDDRFFLSTENHVEEHVDIPTIYEGHGGTPDHWFYDKHLYTLDVTDLKYGWGIVEPRYNWQMLDYAAGIIRKYGLLVKEIRLTVYQPRPPHVDGRIRTWSLTPETLWQCEAHLFRQAVEARGPNPQIVTGKHCRDCLAITGCVAATEAGYNAITVSQGAQLEKPTAQQVADQLEIFELALDAVKNRLKGLQTIGESMINSGEVIPGWGLDTSYGNHKFNRSIEHMKGIAALYEVNITKETLITPNQAIKAGLPKDVANSYKSKPRNGVKLTRRDGVKQAKEFSKWLTIPK